MPHNQRNEELILTASQKDNPAAYPEYDNYDAIEVGKVKDIPQDYDGKMGVPITFLLKHNPNQFEIVGFDRDVLGKGRFNGCGNRFQVKGAEKYARLVIRRKKEQ